MNGTLDVIKNRYSCRAFSDRPVDAGLLAKVAEAGAQSPSANNSQKWHIVVVSDKGLIDEIEKAGLAEMEALPDKSLIERIRSRGGVIFYNAPVLIAVAVDASGKDLPMLDCGICVENITIAAESLGLNTLICGLAGFGFQGGNEAKFGAKLKFPPGYKLGMTVLVGYESGPGKPHMPDPEKITYIR